jgi:CRP/FNR family cyclic AMP-dependent transcriptional regulator
MSQRGLGMIVPSKVPSKGGRADNALSHIRAFQNLPPQALSRLASSASPMDLGNGAEVFSQGDPADSVYAVIGGEGRVRIGVIDRRSKKLMVEVFGAGDIFGEIGVIDVGTRTASAVTDGRVRLMRISASAFMAVLNDTPALGASLTIMLARRLRRTFALFQDATFETLEVRLARQLLYLATVQGRPNEQGVVLGSRLRQPDLADLLGATTRSIITILNTWRAEGIVRFNAEQARLTISDEARLRSLVAET